MTASHYLSTKSQQRGGVLKSFDRSRRDIEKADYRVLLTCNTVQAVADTMTCISVPYCTLTNGELLLRFRGRQAVDLLQIVYPKAENPHRIRHREPARGTASSPVLVHVRVCQTLLITEIKDC